MEDNVENEIATCSNCRYYSATLGADNPDGRTFYFKRAWERDAGEVVDKRVVYKGKQAYTTCCTHRQKYW